MMMELTFDAAGGVAAGGSQALPASTRVDDVAARYAHVRPAEDARAIGRDIVRAQEWHAAVVLVGLLALGVLTFGYAFDSLATHQATSVPAVAVSE